MLLCPFKLTTGCTTSGNPSGLVSHLVRQHPQLTAWRVVEEMVRDLQEETEKGMDYATQKETEESKPPARCDQCGGSPCREGCVP